VAEKVEKGDHVQIGFGKVHWVVEGDPWKTDPDSPYWVFNLKSGMTERRRTEVCRMADLTVIRKGQP